MSNESVVEQKHEINVAERRKKPRLAAILFCDFANISRDEKVNILGIFDRIFVHPDREWTPRFTLFVRTTETREEPFRVNGYSPQGELIIAIQLNPFDNVTLADELPANIQLLTNIQFQVKEEGIYWFDVVFQGESLGGTSLVIEYRETEDKSHGTDTYV